MTARGASAPSTWRTTCGCIARSANCRYNPSICLATFLEKVEAVDDLTVAFTLKQKLSTFATIYLPAILIESKDAVDASYELVVAKLPKKRRP